MDYRKADRYSNILIIAALPAALLGYLTLWISGIALLLLAAGIYIKAKYWRCPHCGASLPWRTFTVPVHCMMCGEKLSDPPKDKPI
ncbi:MAG TPA: hypothetical protein VN366_06755 [Feifaniaceae bacterium]|nr:hypothetical protein [Feifaniaceae bacterium]